MARFSTCAAPRISRRTAPVIPPARCSRPGRKIVFVFIAGGERKRWRQLNIDREDIGRLDQLRHIASHRQRVACDRGQRMVVQHHGAARVDPFDYQPHALGRREPGRLIEAARVADDATKVGPQRGAPIAGDFRAARQSRCLRRRQPQIARCTPTAREAG